jgi:hypothetical protein
VFPSLGSVSLTLRGSFGSKDEEAALLQDVGRYLCLLTDTVQHPVTLESSILYLMETAMAMRFITADLDWKLW